ncbi:MAG TPA: membrane protein insertase YidC [Rhodanobacteraceae bacterium]|nr:membrane protein insertase YidC [Rhodanobacteraceae bacterium]
MINQTRTLLVVALFFVAYLLWQAWQHDYPSVPPPASPASAQAVAVASAVPEAASIPTAASSTATAASLGTAAPAGNAGAAPTPKQDLVTVSNDVLKLTIDPRGGTIVGAALLGYPQQVRRGSPPVQLLDDATANYYVAQDGLVGAGGSAAPSHLAEFRPEATTYALGPGQKQVVVTLTWADPASGIGVVKRYTLTRGSYVIELSQQVDNRGSKTWQGSAYEQLDRIEPPPPPKHLLEFYNPDSYAFTGAAWYSDKYNKLKFADFEKDPLHASVTGGWIAMSQRFFVAAWIPDAKLAQQFGSVETPAADASGKPRYLIRTVGPGFSVAPGASATRTARLYVGPKLQDRLGDIAPGLDRTVDYGMWTFIAQPMFKLLAFLHKLVGAWGLAIIVLVLLIQAATWKLTEAQYKAGARMRKLQPRLKALKERFGDDKQKYQQAMMELYKKEKINPMAGCLPALITFPIFFALYYVLIFSVELRHATFLWIPDLSAADPLFILPVVYALTMLGQQFLTPVQGMDPTQAKIMKAMPVLFAVLFFFFPAGLTLYYVVRGLCMLGQQWYITRKIDRADARARA